MQPSFVPDEMLTIAVVDGASWRLSGSSASFGGMEYPDVLLLGKDIENVTGKKKSKAKL